MGAVGIDGFLDVDEQVAEVEYGQAEVALAHHPIDHAAIEVEIG